MLVAAVIAGSGLPAHALSALRQINVSMGGISLYVDGKLQVPTDVNGNEVEPLIYAGTTYLPVRALTGMLTDKEVEWDSKTESVYIGLKPGEGQVVRAEEMTLYNKPSESVAYTGKDAQFKLLGETQMPFNRYKWGNTIKLDGLVFCWSLINTFKDLRRVKPGLLLLNTGLMWASYLASYRVLANSTTGNKKKLIGKQYQFYRQYLQLSPMRSLVNTLRWGINGLKKYGGV